MKHTLLVVEDDFDTSEMLRVYFEAQNYQVIPAYTGEEALIKCQALQPDLILLDVRLPDMDGFEVGKILQNELKTSRLPIIFVTERREREFRIAGLRLGAVDYITKPFDVQELRLRVRNTLRRVGSQNNPVTGLAGSELTWARLDVLSDHQNWAVLSIFISGLDIFNEIYGFVARDDVLRAIALILNGAVDESGTMDDFVGHPAEGKFIIITRLAKLDSLKQRIQDRLKQAMVYFYPIHDRELGYVFREGNENHRVDVPFMQLSIKSFVNDTVQANSLDSLLDWLNPNHKPQ